MRNEKDEAVLSGGIEIGRRVRVGATSSGRWMLRFNERGVALEGYQAFCRIKLLLERPFPEVRALIDSYRSEHGISTEPPCAEVVRAGLEDSADYWVALALRWLNDLGNDSKPKLADALRIAATGKRASQRNRQAAAREAKRLASMVSTFPADDACAAPSDKHSES